MPAIPMKLSKRSATASSSTSQASSVAPVREAPSTFTDGLPLPKLIVFDLDYTLWPFWVDTHVSAPLKPSSSHDFCTDKHGEEFRFYSDVPSILSAIRAHNITIGVASRTCAPDLAREMLKLLYITSDNGSASAGKGAGGKGKTQKAIEYFDYLEIYPGSKTTHFNRLQRATGVDYSDCLFFDDEERNRNVETLGVTMQLVRDGVTRNEVDKGVNEWRRRRGHSKTK